MADIEAAGNGKLELKVGDKSLGIGGKDIVLLVFIILVGAMSYLRTISLDSGMTELKVGQATMISEMHEQNRMMAAQTIELRADMDRQNSLLNNNNGQLKQMLLRLNHNIGREDHDKVPLEMDTPMPGGK